MTHEYRGSPADMVKRHCLKARSCRSRTCHAAAMAQLQAAQPLMQQSPTTVTQRCGFLIDVFGWSSRRDSTHRWQVIKALGDMLSRWIARVWRTVLCLALSFIPNMLLRAHQAA